MNREIYATKFGSTDRKSIAVLVLAVTLTVAYLLRGDLLFEVRGEQVGIGPQNEIDALEVSD